METYTNLMYNFIIGGLITASLSYIGTYFNPLIAAILWAYPVSLIPVMYYMYYNGKSLKYVGKFAIISTYALIILFLTLMCLGYFLKSSKTFWGPVGKSIIVWILLSVIYFYIIKFFNLENKF